MDISACRSSFTSNTLGDSSRALRISWIVASLLILAFGDPALGQAGVHPNDPAAEEPLPGSHDFKVRVVDDSGQPVPGAMVSLWNWKHTVAGPMRIWTSPGDHPDHKKSTDEDGVASFSGKINPRVRLQVVKGARVTKSEHLINNPRDLFTMVLSQRHEFQVKVVDPLGLAVSGQSLRLKVDGLRPNTLVLTTDGEGMVRGFFEGQLQESTAVAIMQIEAVRIGAGNPRFEVPLALEGTTESVLTIPQSRRLSITVDASLGVPVSCLATPPAGADDIEGDHQHAISLHIDAESRQAHLSGVEVSGRWFITVSTQSSAEGIGLTAQESVNVEDGRSLTELRVDRSHALQKACFQFVDDDGKPVPGKYFNVRILDKNGSLQGPRIFFVKTDNQGFVALENLGQAQNTVLIYGANIIEIDEDLMDFIPFLIEKTPPCWKFQIEQEVDGRGLHLGQLKASDVPLVAAGLVVDKAGRPLPNAVVQLLPVPQEGKVQDARNLFEQRGPAPEGYLFVVTNETGRFELRGRVGADRYLVSAAAPGLVAPPVLVDAGTRELRFQLQPGAVIEGRLKDYREELGPVWVAAAPSDPLLAAQAVAFQSRFTTKVRPDGSFALSGLLDGSHTVHAMSEYALVARCQGLEIKDGKVSKAPPELVQLPWIEGVFVGAVDVVDAAGQPVPSFEAHFSFFQSETQSPWKATAFGSPAGTWRGLIQKSDRVNVIIGTGSAESNDIRRVGLMSIKWPLRVVLE